MKQITLCMTDGVYEKLQKYCMLQGIASRIEVVEPFPTLGDEIIKSIVNAVESGYGGIDLLEKK